MRNGEQIPVDRVTHDRMFTGGTDFGPDLLTTYDGPGSKGEIIQIMGSMPIRGIYVLIQMDLKDTEEPLNLLEVYVIGSQGLQLFCCVSLVYLFNLVLYYKMYLKSFSFSAIAT